MAKGKIAEPKQNKT